MDLPKYIGLFAEVLREVVCMPRIALRMEEFLILFIIVVFIVIVTGFFLDRVLLKNNILSK